MHVKTFDIINGNYRFVFDRLPSTTLHTHPAAEIIVALNGTFSIATPGERYDNLTAVFIPHNVPHRIISSDCATEVIMLEKYGGMADIFCQQAATHDNGVKAITRATSPKIDADDLWRSVLQRRSTLIVDERVRAAMFCLSRSSVDYGGMLSEIVAVTHLSASRISHLFKTEVGISLKKYLVWCRLKRAFHVLLTEDTTLREAAHAADFYDQAHLSRAFKSMLGIPPSGLTTAEPYKIRTSLCRYFAAKKTWKPELEKLSVPTCPPSKR